MPQTTVTAALTLTDRQGVRAGEDRIRLLEMIGVHGSISRAAKAVGVSYKTAWDAVNALNNLFPKPLVVASPGGRTGGCALLTPEGRQVIDAFRLLHGELDRFLGLLAHSLQRTDAPPNLSTLLWSIVMRTSARNTFRGTIASVTPGAVNAEVILKINGDVEIVAIVTNRSVETLNLTSGKEAFAMIKASFVILAAEDEAFRTTARNRICGTVIEKLDGAVNDEIVLDIGHGRTLTATVTKESSERLGFQVGKRACALIKASHVILAVD